MRYPCFLSDVQTTITLKPCTGAVLTGAGPVCTSTAVLSTFDFAHLGFGALLGSGLYPLLQMRKLRWNNKRQSWTSH